jgi:teichoic acid transport system permease protein
LLVSRIAKYIAFSLLSFFLFFFLLNLLSPIPSNYSVDITLLGIPKESIQLFYGSDSEFSEERSLTSQLSGEKGFHTLSFVVKELTPRIRLDLGNTPGGWTIKELVYYSFLNKYKVEINASDFIGSNQIMDIQKKKNGETLIQTNGADPYFLLPFPQDIREKILKANKQKEYLQNSLAALIPAFISVLLLKLRRRIVTWLKSQWVQRSLIINLAKNDFKTKYAGSYLGVIWAFVQPLVTVLVYWFVFQIGFKAGPMQSAPFILWFVAGMVPWFFFSDAITNASNSLIEYNYLVKKIVFNIEILPIVKHLSSLFVHLFFIVLTLGVFIAYGYIPKLESIQIVYYSFCSLTLSYALSLICCSLIVFFKDLGQIISLILQFGMWVTPILWSYTMVAEPYRWLLKINPMYYIVEGYRDSLIGHIWFWERFYETLYFWLCCVAFLFIGSFLFKRLRPHFADVL